MPSWFMFVRVENPSGEDNFDDAESLAESLTPIEFDFALLDDRPGVIRDWAKSRWGHEVGLWVRVWEVGAVCGGSEHWIPRIMDIWARDV